MGIFNKLFGGESDAKKKITDADKIVDVIRTRTTMDFVRLIPENGAAKPWSSKIGGMPYMPVGFVYPYDETEVVVKPAEVGKTAPVQEARKGLDPFNVSGTGSVPEPVKVEEMNAVEVDGQAEEVVELEKKPLRFLGQINFSEMPPLEGFSMTGILQFFISGENTYGLNFERRAEQKGFRIIYHERVTMDYSDLQLSLPTDDMEWKDTFPVEGEMKLGFKKDTMAMTDQDFRFEKLLLKVYNETHPELPVPSLDRVDDSLLDEVYEKLEGSGHRVGGYPFFSQLDPREYDEAFKEHTCLLFQLDSDEEHGISWGDCGVCNFFIRPADLEKHDFSNVLYNWDCY